MTAFFKANSSSAEKGSGLFDLNPNLTFSQLRTTAAVSDKGFRIEPEEFEQKQPIRDRRRV